MINIMRQAIKRKLCKRWGMPYSQFGMASILYDCLKGKSDLIFIDIGAHNGDFSNTVAACCSVKKGVIVEPISDKAQRLKAMFNGPEYDVLDCLVSDVDGEIEFEINELSETSSILHIKKDIPEHAQINTSLREKILKQSKTLDALISELNLGKVDLLKIDVQGAEHLVLEGAKNSLSKINMIWTEVSFKPLYDNSSTFFDIHKILTDSDFRFVGMSPVFYGPDGELLQCDALFIHG